MAYDENIYRGVGLDLQRDPLIQLQEGAREQFDNAAAFGRGVRQTASGVAGLPGKTLAGMDATLAAPNREASAAGEAYLNSLYQRSGAGQPPQQPQQQPVYAPRGVTSGGMPDKFTADGADIPGSAMRIQAANPRQMQPYTASVNTFDRDAPKELAAASQSRFGGDAMSQLQNIRELNAMTPQGGVGILGELAPGITRDDLDNARKGMQWHGDPAYAMMLKQIYGGQQDQGVAMDRNRVMDRESQNRLLGTREQAASQERVAGLNATSRERGETERAKLMLANTRLAGEMQGANQMGLERLKQSDPKNEGLMQYYAQMGDNAAATAEKTREELKFGKSLDGQYTKGLEQVSKLMNAGLTEQAEKLYRDLTEAYAFRQHQAKKKAAPEAYAKGGDVQNPQTVDAQHEADMRARYAKAGLVYPGAPKVEAPAEQAPAQQAPAEQTWADHLRGVATGGLEKRMRAFAKGGDVDMRQFMAESNKRQYAEGFRQNIEGVRTNYETFGRGQPADKMQRRLDNYSDDAHAAVEQANREADNSTYRETRGAARYAGGGDVDVSGRQVFGVGSAAPTGPKSDTIPAVIDGTQPAALDHGEYVIPAEVVRKYGTDFFDKLLAKSRQGEGKGLDTGRNSA